MTFYHVDRGSTLKENTIINLDIQFNNFYDAAFQNLSSHGVGYFSQGISSPSSIYELALEFVRNKHYPHYPSRFKCFFANETREEAEKWALKYVKNTTLFQIVTVETNNYFKFDVNWLSLKQQDITKILEQNIAHCSMAYYLYVANKYWSQEQSSDPSIEVLIPLPCEITRCDQYQIDTNVIKLNK